MEHFFNSNLKTIINKNNGDFQYFISEIAGKLHVFDGFKIEENLCDFVKILNIFANDIYDLKTKNSYEILKENLKSFFDGVIDEYFIYKSENIAFVKYFSFIANYLENKNENCLESFFGERIAEKIWNKTFYAVRTFEEETLRRLNLIKENVEIYENNENICNLAVFLTYIFYFEEKTEEFINTIEYVQILRLITNKKVVLNRRKINVSRRKMSQNCFLLFIVLSLIEYFDEDCRNLGEILMKNIKNFKYYENLANKNINEVEIEIINKNEIEPLIKLAKETYKTLVI